MKIIGIDHMVLTVRDIEKTVKFYGSVSGIKAEVFAGGRIALKFRR